MGASVSNLLPTELREEAVEPSPYRVVAVGLVAAGAFIAGALFIGAWIVGAPSYNWPLLFGAVLLGIGFFSALGVAASPSGRAPSALQRLDQRVVGKRGGESVTQTEG
jgi:MFS family permease